MKEVSLETESVTDLLYNLHNLIPSNIDKNQTEKIIFLQFIWRNTHPHIDNPKIYIYILDRRKDLAL